MRRPVTWHYKCPKCGHGTGALDPTLTHCPIPWLPDGTHPAGADLSTMLECGAEYEDGPFAYYDELAAAGLLCTPQERAVIDAAIAETETETAWLQSVGLPGATKTSRAYGSAREARRVAVAEHKVAS